MSSPWNGRRILVTGGAGFLGSHLVETLAAAGARDVAVPRSAQYDLTRADAADALLAEARPDVIFHLAARVGGIGANRRHPAAFFRDNMAMGMNLLDAAHRAGTRKVVQVGTVCSYPKHTPVPFREDDLWNGYPEETNAPYGVAKRALLVMAQAYRREYGMNVVTLLPVNLYGPRDRFDPEDSHVIPAMIRKFAAAVATNAPEVVLWGDGTVTREFLYVSDAAEALVLAAERYDDGEPVNVGSGSEITIRDLAATIAGLLAYRGRIVWDPSQPNGQPRRRLDVRRAMERFGWSSRTPLGDGLSRTIAWWQNREGSP